MTPVCAFVIPGDITLPTGGYAYDRELLKRLPAQGVAITHLALPGSFPQPTANDMALTGQLLLALPYEHRLLIDGLAYGAFPSSAAAGLAGRVIALVHHPLALETGIKAARAAELAATEKLNLSYAAHVITTSAATRDSLVADYAVPPERITIALPGVACATRAIGSSPGQPLQLLAVGSIVPRKGHDVLVAALSGLLHLPWHLTIAGADDRAPETAAALRAQIAAAGLESRITLTGAVSDVELETLYAGADIFVMASHHEGYGMVLAEALAHGLPIVSTTGGALAQTAPEAACLKLPPGDTMAMADALSHIMQDHALRQRLSDAAWQLAPTLPSWDETARIVADVLKARY
jgi:glycosyltransferase involved in cell wall biosynthesis